jgi:hypothetical protein
VALVRPSAARLERLRATEAAHTAWVRKYADQEAGLPLGEVGPESVANQHTLDIAATAEMEDDYYSRLAGGRGA